MSSRFPIRLQQFQVNIKQVEDTHHSLTARPGLAQSAEESPEHPWAGGTGCAGMMHPAVYLGHTPLPSAAHGEAHFTEYACGPHLHSLRQTTAQLESQSRVRLVVSACADSHRLNLLRAHRPVQQAFCRVTGHKDLSWAQSFELGTAFEVCILHAWDILTHPQIS